MKTSHANKAYLIFFEFCAILLILGLGSYLRFTNINENPGWYSDEGTLINIANNLLLGKFQYLAINQSLLLAARLPLFPILLAGMITLFGYGIGTLRIFTSSLGVISIGLLYIVVRRFYGREGVPLALLSAFMLAIYPLAVLYNRLGFSYNLLTPLILLIWLGLGEYLRTEKPSWLALAVLSLGIGSVSDLMILTLALPVIFVVSIRQKRDLIWSLPLLLLPFVIYSVLMLCIAPEAFKFDLGFLITRLKPPFLVQLPLLAVNFYYLIIWVPWLAPGMIGLFILHTRRWQRLSLLLFLFPIIALGRTVGLSGFGFYYLSPLFPFIAHGMASLLIQGTYLVSDIIRDSLEYLLSRWGFQPGRKSLKWLKNRAFGLAGGLSLFLFFGAPLLISTLMLISQVRFRMESSVDSVLIDPDDSREVIALVNRLSKPNDVIIASPAIAWGFQAQTVDFQLALAAEGIKTEHFPANIPKDRFAFDPRFDKASFVVIDRIWRNWASIRMPELARMVKKVEKWPLVFELGEFSVYQNPDR